MFTSGYLISKCATHPFNILLVYPAIVLTRAFGIARPVFRYAERLSAHNWVLRIVSNFRKSCMILSNQPQWQFVKSIRLAVY